MLDKVKERTIACPQCGLEVRRLYSTDQGQTEIDAIRYVETCTIAPDRAAFDFDCPKLQQAIGAAIRQEKEVGSRDPAPVVLNDDLGPGEDVFTHLLNHSKQETSHDF